MSAEEAPRWPQFRGPGGAGVAEGTKQPPIAFGPDKGLLWKTALPVGHSSPAIWGDRIFVTGFSKQEKRLETLCLDRASGRMLWRRAVPAADIEPHHETSNPAASTPATDGRAVYVYFGSYGLVAYDLDGKELWSRPLPMAKSYQNQGSATSPIVAGDSVLLDVSLEADSYLLAVRASDGQTAWTFPKPKVNGGWSTPAVWKEGDETLVGILNPGRFTAHSMRDGKERWWVEGLPFQACATPVVGEGLLFLSVTGPTGELDNVTLPPGFDEMIARHDANRNGRIEIEEIPESLLFSDRRAGHGAGNMSVRRLVSLFPDDGKPPTSLDRAKWDSVLKGTSEFMAAPMMQSTVMAVRVGGSGDVTRSHVLWQEPRGVPEVPSPLLYRDRLYLVKNGGIVLSREAATGRTVFQGRLGAAGGYYASPLAAGDVVYAASDLGHVVVFRAGDTLEVLARNELPEAIMATPAIVDGTLYVRAVSHLYAFASGKPQ